ncbi:FH interacting FIP2-like, partial [Paramuricea clavata]
GQIPELQIYRTSADADVPHLHRRGFCNRVREVRSHIKLDVGGHIYSTSLSTLTRDKFSMLAVMFSGRHKLVLSKENTYFIDRDGTHFRYILNYLRGDLHLDTFPDDVTVLKEIQREADYFQLSGMPEPREKNVVPVTLFNKTIELDIIQIRQPAPVLRNSFDFSTEDQEYLFFNLHDHHWPLRLIYNYSESTVTIKRSRWAFRKSPGNEESKRLVPRKRKNGRLYGSYIIITEEGYEALSRFMNKPAWLIIVILVNPFIDRNYNNQRRLHLQYCNRCYTLGELVDFHFSIRFSQLMSRCPHGNKNIASPGGGGGSGVNELHETYSFKKA